jgi:tetratricopeptide (TPR) repeat protein
LAQGDLARPRAVLEASPEDPNEKHDESALIAFYEHDFAKAMTEVELARKSKMAYQGASADLMEGSIARAQGDTAKAWEAFEKARVILEEKRQRRPEDASTLGDLAWAYAGLGRKDEALKASQQSVYLVPSWRDALEGPGLASMQAQTLAWVGEKDAAINQLASLVKRPGGPQYGYLKFDPGWAGLRTDPRFEKLVAETMQPIPLD